MATDVRVNIIGTDRASATFNRIAAVAGTTAARLDRAGAAMTRAGRKMQKLTMPIALVSAVSMKMAADFQGAMEKIHTQAGGSQHDVEVLSKKVLDLAKYAQQGPKELADSLYHLKSVGMDNAKAMDTLRRASDFASLSGANLEETTNALAGAWRTGIKGATNMHQAVATLNAIVGAGNMRISDLNDALGTGFLASAKTFGLSLKDVGSALALFTDEGVPANAAATRLRMTFSLLGAPSARAEKQLEKIHLTGLQLADDMRKPNGLIRAVGDLKSHLDKSGLSASQAAQLLSHAFGGGRSSSAILSMVNNFDVLKQKQDQVTRGMGKFDAAVAAQRKTAQAQFHLMISSLEVAAIKLGNIVMPVATTIAHGIGHIVDGFSALPGPIQKTIVYIGLLAAATGPALRVTGALTTGVSRLIRVGKGIGRVVAGIRLVETSTAAMETRSYSAGMRIRRVFSAIGTGALAMGRYVGRSFKAAGAAMAGIPAAMRAAEGLGGKLAAVGTGAMGAATALGPMALGLAATGGLLWAGISAFNAYKAHQQALSDETKSFTQAILDNNGALGANTRLIVAQALQSSGAADQAEQLHISLYRMTTTVMKGGAPLDALISRLHKLREANVQFVNGGNGVQSVGYNKLGAAARDLLNTLSDQKGVVAKAKKSAQQLGSMLGKQATTTDKASTATKSLSTAEIQAKAAAKAAADETKRLSDAINNLDHGGIAAGQAYIAFRQTLSSLTQSVKQNGDALNGNSAAALANRSAVFDALDSAKQYASALKDQGKSAGQVARALSGTVRSLIATARQSGMSNRQIRHLIGTMHMLPRQIRTRLLVNTGAADAALNRLHNHLLRVANQRYVAIVQAGGSPNTHTGGNRQTTPGFAAGGPVPDGWFKTGEQGWEAGYKRGNKVMMLSHSKSVAKFGAHAEGLGGLGALASMRRAVTPRPVDSTSSREPARPHDGRLADTIQIVEAGDPMRTVREVSRYQRMRAAV